ncbi:dihydroorotase [Fulvivirga sedimenti]|uniref:Dihydroorotase n=1 Tax=Fulvivirga sedimenti TaxID=2879465 RepID=A0A9X1HT58_9BACT|nr:dihydroorotase [Fulvivirga sedimenti]MCA6075316.1 dihydroorotase [Fulvivirga sedimenti]MCA6076493.1 dihydroorotase [Fulvivirga sedimenti]MCA6077621.1 dihydroorotase [Fulvivirga sedimenti]
MKLLIKGARICDRNSPFHGKVKDVLIDRGRIGIAAEGLKTDKVINGKGMFLTPGWVDMWCWLADPGFEHKETLESGLSAAAAGGFTGIALLPNNQPVTQSKNDIISLKNAAKGVTEIFPLAAVTRETNGTELTEMIDLHSAGAVGFTDGFNPIWHSDILLKSLQYLQKFDGILINRPEDRHLTQFATMHEGIQSTMLGMKGMPELAESLMISRDIDLLRYAGGKIHFSTISAGESVALIRQAKKEGLNVTCDMAGFQTEFLDEDLNDFDTNLKVNPPFRNKTNRRALIRGLKDNTVDVIVSAHCPQDEESKKLEFDLADFGLISLQTLGANLVSLSEEIPLEQLLDKVSVRPREILGMPAAVIDDGREANLTLFDPNAEWEFNGSSNRSNSRNSPYIGKKLKGKAVAVIRGTTTELL